MYIRIPMMVGILAALSPAHRQMIQLGNWPDGSSITLVVLFILANCKDCSKKNQTDFFTHNSGNTQPIPAISKFSWKLSKWATKDIKINFPRKLTDFEIFLGLLKKRFVSGKIRSKNPQSHFFGQSLLPGPTSRALWDLSLSLKVFKTISWFFLLLQTNYIK